ncbi:MAG: hypothetical protein IRZ10_00570 [Thermoflavifilum sp.]|nr:hypothetical protein [Thermoflavifilum sp.]MCL6512880.1 hypothetical protein [Alicyclobacillus sp.]
MTCEVSCYFRFDERLGIECPAFDPPFESLPRPIQEAALAYWEKVRSGIPDRIQSFETRINALLARIQETDDWDEITRCFDEISDLATRIQDLNLWARVDPSLPS